MVSIGVPRRRRWWAAVSAVAALDVSAPARASAAPLFSTGRPAMRSRWIAVAAVSLVSVALAVGPSAARSAPTAPEPLYPNIVEQIPHHLLIQNDHQREWLRFSTTHINLGPGNLQVRGGGQVGPCEIDGEPIAQCTFSTQEILDSSGQVVLTHPAGVAFFHPEHNHWHQSGVAEFQIKRDDPACRTRDDANACAATGVSVAKGVKITFCLVDLTFTGVTGTEKKVMPRNYFECNRELQGISVGWGDAYHQSTPLQELEVTGLAEGDYYLTHLADPENHWLEGKSATSPGEQDNFTWLKFHLSRTGANPEITLLDHSPCTGPVCGTNGNP